MSADRVSLTPEPTGSDAPEGSPEPKQHDARPTRAGRTEGAQILPEADGPDGPAPDRPSWLPERFNSPEEFAQYAAHLEERLGGALPTVPGGGPPPAPAPAPEGQSLGLPDAPADPTAPTQGLVQELTEAYAQRGEVPTELREKFTQQTGLPDTFIDNQIAYMRHQEQAALTAAKTRLGGESAVAELTEWASKNLSQEDREAFNRAVYSNNQAALNLAVDGLASRYEAAVGSSPRLVAGRKPMAEYGGLKPFQSEGEWQAARRDPKYKADSAYRREVDQRMAISSKLGFL